MAVRNFLFDTGIINSKRFKIPNISVGNLAIGGTGKTPHVEYLLSLFDNKTKTAILSRGYKRRTSGFILANEGANSQTIGDEPFQIFKKFPHVTIVVDEKRVHGVKKLLQLIPDLNLIILDDAFQHRYIQAGLSILLTDYSNLYTVDSVLPAGTLRESYKGSKRADIIVVTKCPKQISPIEMRIVEDELKIKTYQSMFFSSYEYADIEAVFPGDQAAKLSSEQLKANKTGILIVAGIAKPQSMLDYLQNYTLQLESLIYADHHAFNSKDIREIKDKFEKLNTDNKLIIVTEKDAARIASQPTEWEALKDKLYKLPIRVKILNNQENIFKNKIYNYVTENSRNS